ncbi:MAG: radical SAM protein [Gallionella sp.]|nr:radical SAM protein [Gallionella sp.]
MTKTMPIIIENKIEHKLFWSGNKIKPKVKFVSVESGITALGFRKVAAIARSLNSETDICFIPVNNLYSFISHIFPNKKTGFGEYDAKLVASYLANADIICFSTMTASAEQTKAIISQIKNINPDTFILLGGVHSIIYPEDAIQMADAICLAEGEIPFEAFYRNFEGKKDFASTPGMWFNTPSGVKKNAPPPLNANDVLSNFPHLYDGLDCKIYDLDKKEMRDINQKDYAAFHGLTHRTLWSIGCPFSCTYCANDVFIGLDKKYTKLRYPSVDYIIDELLLAIENHPHISTIAFYDDNFIALPLDVISEFATKYKEKVGLPFVVFGVHPNIVSKEKIDLLSSVGMNRVRMGIQSGSAKMLEFYQRRTSQDKIRTAVSILAKAANEYNQIPPAYDVISDNPLETRADILESLNFFYALDRPYTLTIFSLRVFPGTQLWNFFANHPEYGNPQEINSSYLDTRKSMGNVLLYMLGTFKPPKIIWNFLLQYVRGYDEPQPDRTTLHFICRNIYLIKRAVDHLLRFDFTVIVGKWTWYVWKTGLVGKKR